MSGADKGVLVTVNTVLNWGDRQLSKHQQATAKLSGKAIQFYLSQLIINYLVLQYYDIPN